MLARDLLRSMTMLTGVAQLRSEEERMKKLLTVTEPAEVLGLKSATIRVWLAQRRLPHVACGRAVRIPAEAIAQFIERNTIPACELQTRHSQSKAPAVLEKPEPTLKEA